MSSSVTANRARRDRLHAEGKCTRCGKPNPTPERKVCTPCQQVCATKARERRAAAVHPIKLWVPLTTKHREGDATWGSSEDDGERDGPHRNRGVRGLTRAIDIAERAEREIYGRSPYAWRHFTGPAPVVDHGDTKAAMAYVFWLNLALEKGGWSSNETAGLRREQRKWFKREMGLDDRYNLYGNKPGRLVEQFEKKVGHGERSERR